MGRRKRPHLPGMIFHLVSRTHRREPWFVPAIRTPIAGLIQRMVGRTDAQLIAYAVMPNHLHVVVRQGQSQLGTIMQPLMRRVAHLVQKYHGFEGGVVERRYRDRPCASARHVRAAIVYTHLNPWRAGLCEAPAAYPWTTQPAYQPGGDPALFGIDPTFQLRVLELFATIRGQPRDQRCRDYIRWVEWSTGQDRIRNGVPEDAITGQPLACPATHVGDLAWRDHFMGSAPSKLTGPGALPDLRDFIHGQIGQLAPALGTEQLRGSWLPRPLARVRIGLVKMATEQGYGTGAIATFFDISPQTVSRAKYAPDVPHVRHVRTGAGPDGMGRTGNRKRGPECRELSPAPLRPHY